jgi:hypothetical protein
MFNLGMTMGRAKMNLASQTEIYKVWYPISVLILRGDEKYNLKFISNEVQIFPWDLDISILPYLHLNLN